MPDMIQIDVRVGAIGFHGVPVLPFIEADFTGLPPNARARVPDRLAIACENRFYRIYEPGKEATPFAERDEAVDQVAHELFQRLRTHWGYWFLRVHERGQTTDYQVLVGDKVVKLQHKPETGLDILERSKEEAVRELTRSLEDKYDKLAGTIARGEISKWEALVGPLPIGSKPRTRSLSELRAELHRLKSDKRAVDREKNNVLATLKKTVREISDAEFPEAIRIAQQVAAENNDSQAITVFREEALRRGVTLESAVIQKLRVLVRQPSGASMFLDLTGNVDAELKRMMGGSFASVVWENQTADGGNLVLMVSDQKKGPAHQVWSRGLVGAKGKKIGTTTNIAGIPLPLERFNYRDLESIRDEDLAAIAKIDGTQGTATPAAMRLNETNEVDKKLHERIVERYLMLCNMVKTMARQAEPNAVRVWPKLRDAVIFEMTASVYETLQIEFWNHVLRTAGCNPAKEAEAYTLNERKRAQEVVEQGRRSPFPDKLPFKSCFLAYGDGVDGIHPRRADDPAEIRFDETATLVGHLVTADGEVVGFRYANMTNGQPAITYAFDREAGEWGAPGTLVQWIVPATIAYLQDHKTITEGHRGLSYRSLLKKSGQRLGYQPNIPPPFYTVYMRDGLVREHAKRTSSGIRREIDWQHRWRCEGSWNIRFMRGPLPLDPELECTLRKRKYQVFTVEQPGGDLMLDLVKRGVAAKQPGEWLAILKYWRSEHVKGPENRPLVESVRKPTKQIGDG